MNRCQTCRHWSAPSGADVGPGGLCKAVDHRFEGGGPNAHLYTAHDFGCVAHEAAVFKPIPGPAECRTCRHYQPGSPTAAAGTCRIKAPVVLVSDGSAYWPRVAQYEWCGDHARRSVPVEG